MGKKIVSLQMQDITVSFGVVSLFTMVSEEDILHCLQENVFFTMFSLRSISSRTTNLEKETLETQ